MVIQVGPSGGKSEFQKRQERLAKRRQVELERARQRGEIDRARQRGEIDRARRAALTPTPTEEELRMSLPADLRELSPKEVLSRQSFPTGGRTIQTQVLASSPTEGTVISRQQLQDIRQQSLPRGTTGIIPRQRGRVSEFLFGETGRGLIGFNIQPKLFGIVREKDITVTDIQRGLGRLGLPGRAAAVSLRLIETPGALLITGGLAGATILAPPAGQAIISGGVGALGIRGALDPSLLPEERIVSGIGGALGVTGVAAVGTPFLRGFGRRGVRVAPEGFETITGVTEAGQIGLIQPGPTIIKLTETRGLSIIRSKGVDLPPTSPLVRGAFQVRPFEKQQFLGSEQLLATSQRGFFRAGRQTTIERPFFVTPQEPTLRIPETRVSRLALQEPFKFPETFEIGFGLPPTPQIGVVRGRVARGERGGAFAIGRGTELEAVRTTGVITDVRQIGGVRIKGQGVDIFEFRLGADAVRPRGLRPKDIVSTRPTTRISGETILSGVGRRTTRGISRPISPAISPVISLGISPQVSVPLSPGISPPVSPPISLPKSPTISPRISPRLLPSVSPPTSPIISPQLFPSALPPTRPLRRLDDGRQRPLKRKRVRRRFRGQVAPSFTAEALGLTGIFPKEFRLGKLDLGILPREIRVIPKRKRKKRKKRR